MRALGVLTSGNRELALESPMGGIKEEALNILASFIKY